MFAKRAISLLFILAAAPAFADGRTQLERSAGVEAGQYSLSELTQIVTADERNDAERLKNYLGTPEAAMSRAMFAPYVGTTRREGSIGSDH